MVFRALHPIVLAGALLALPVVAAWVPLHGAKGRVLPGSGEVRGGTVEVSSPPPPVAADGAMLMPVEVVEAGSVPVRRYVEIQTVPEPSSLMLILPSALLLWFRRR